MAKNNDFKIAIIDNNIAILDSDGTNLVAAKDSLEQYFYKVKRFSKVVRVLALSFAITWFAGFFNLYAQHQMLYAILGIIFIVLSLFSFLEQDEKKGMIERLQKKINLAHASLEEEIFSTKQRLLAQQQTLKTSEDFNHMFKHNEKEINF